MERLKTKKNIIVLTIFAIFIMANLCYFFFFKPNPIFRVNWNKAMAVKGNSVLTLEAPGEVSSVGKKFIVNVNLDTKGYQVNSIQSYIDFDPRVLEVVNTDTADSFCKFYPENNFDNSKGSIKLSCGSPYPGFRGTNNIQKIEFLTKAIKSTDIKINNQSMVLANDGKGTNLLKDFDSATIRVKAGL